MKDDEGTENAPKGRPRRPVVVCEFDDYNEFNKRKGPEPSRPMKFPYTFSAKIAQFPLRHYINNQWIWKYYFIAFACCIPVFWKISRLANSPENKEKWAKIRAKEAAEIEAHEAHMREDNED